MIRFIRALAPGLACIAGFALAPALAQTPAAAQAGASPQTAAAMSQGAESQKQLGQRDKDFLTYAAEDNQAEINLCLLAEKQAMAPAVKAFSRLMVDDHVQVESQLAALANALGQTTPNGMGKEGEQTYTTFEHRPRSAFDTAFLEDQVKDHGRDIATFRKEAAETHNAEIRSFAAVTMPILQQHLDLAKAILASQGSADQSRTE